MSRVFAVRVIQAAIAFSFACAAFVLAWAALLPNALVATETEFDAGERSPGAIVAHTFHLTNQSLLRDRAMQRPNWHVMSRLAEVCGHCH